MENSIRGLFSMSSTNFSSPIAESTHLNGSSMHTKFNWGEGPITSRSRNNSLNRSSKNTNNTSNISGTTTKVSMSPSSHIDARTYVDIHSNGLASRIVKYHDNSTRLNRSLSLGNLYNKPGQFPVVHLKKNESQYKAKKSRNLSMTRIAAPEKSVFHGNTLSSILRSGSVVGLQKTDEEISRENRPILHPPPTESELAPTRSVLEVLKEISRKRINSDELDGTELIKKHCKELEAETYNGQKTMQSKRQREAVVMTTNTQVSPEQQVVKKRMCNYNNDIISSLSSSMLNASKKRMFNIESQTPSNSGFKQTHTANITSTVSHSSRDEKARACASLDLANFVQPIFTPVTPLPSTPQQPPVECVVKEQSGVVPRRASEPVISTLKPKLTLFNKNYDDSPSEGYNEIPEPKDDDDLSGIQFVKPKKSSSLSSGGTLLIEKTKKSKLALMLSGLKGELNEDDEVDAPQTEQKESLQTSTSVASPITSTALLSSAAISFGTVTTTATTPITLPSVASTPATVVPKKTVTTSNPLQLKEPTPASVSSTVGSELKISTTSSTLTNTSATPAVVSSANTTFNPMLPPSSNANSIPTLGGFNFGQNKLLAVPPVTTAPAVISPPTNIVTTQLPAVPTTTAVLSISAPLTTEAAKPFTFGSLTTQSTASTTPAFTFGSSQPLAGSNPVSSSFANAQTPITTASKNPPPIFGQSSGTSQPTFTFGSLAESKPNTTSSTLTPATSAPAVTAPPAFSFGASKSTWDQSATSGQGNNALPAPKGTFSGITTSSSSQPAATTTISAGGFSFGASTTEAPKSLFGSAATVTNNQTQANSTTTFSFSANKAPQQNAQTNANSAFTFGSQAPPPSTTASPAQPAPMFGSTTPVKPANSFSFGSTAPAAPLKGSFSFSSADKPTAPSTTTSNSIGGFSFNAPATSSMAAPESSKNLFAAAAAATTTAPTKPVFSFGSPSTTQAATKPTVFAAPTTTGTNLFGAPATTTAQSSPFTFGSSPSISNQVATTKPSMNSIFGSTSTGAASSSATSSNSIFGGQSTNAAAPQPSSTFTFGASSNNAVDNNKPAGGFVFGSSSSIGSNASKPTTDMNKTFVFGDGSTTITPAPAPTTNLFGGSNALPSANAGGSDNKLFSFGGASAAAPATNNAFGASRQAVNQSPVFNFGTSSPVSTAQVPQTLSNLFAPQPAGTQPTMMGTSDRPIRKAMRRLHKT